ncbi:MAG: hypothetical protein WCB71_05580, partial [Aestuariivirga sp.]
MAPYFAVYGGSWAFTALTRAKRRRYKPPMISRFFSWLENYVDSFPQAGADKPKPTLLAFAFHYTRPFLPLLIASIIFSTAIAFIEVYLFAFIGNLVDLLAKADRATFWETNGLKFGVMGAVVLLVLPLLNFVSEAISHQGLRGNFAMRIRWLAHRYVLRQSM